MPFHPVPNTVEVKIKGDHAGDPRITTLHYRYGPVGGSRPTQAELDDLLGTIIASVLSRLLSTVSNSTRWTELTAQDIHDQAGLTARRILNPILNGGQQGEVCPGNVQLCIGKKSNQSVPWGRGRLFVPDIAEGVQNDAVITPALAALALNLAAELLINRGAIRNFVPVIASKTHVTWTPLIAATFNLVTDSLITRLRDHRRHKRRII
ncbi:MAG TPA: hypothetical protein VJ323_17645 [Bryobacteraceae bacterium]|jgi:hypothetical protein|nr:hypothetical protein [Bryobacteraceae bacterium]